MALETQDLHTNSLPLVQEETKINQTTQSQDNSKVPLATELALAGGVPLAVTLAVYRWLQEVYHGSVSNLNVVASTGTYGVLALAISASVYGRMKMEEKGDKRLFSLAGAAALTTLILSALIQSEIVKTGKRITPHGLTMQVIYMGSEFGISFAAYTAITAAYLGIKAVDTFLTGKNLSSDLY